MTQNLIEKLIINSKNTGASYVEFAFSAEGVAYTSNGGKRRSTKKFKQTKKEIEHLESFLKTFDEKNLLFAGNINRISITWSDGRTAFFERIDHDPYSVIKAKRIVEKKEKTYEFIRFMADDTPDVGIAFALKETKSGRKQINECKGCVVDGIFKTDIASDLRFVVLAPFQVCDGDFDADSMIENDSILFQLSNAMKKAIRKSMTFGLQGIPLFSVLPSSMDKSSVLNDLLVDAAKEACNSSFVFNNRVGRIVNRQKIIIGTDEITGLFPQELYDKIFENGKYWMEEYPLESRAENYLFEIGVPYYDRERFIYELFDECNLDVLSEVVATQKEKWLREFYIFCAGNLSGETAKKRMIIGLKSIKSIRDSKGKMRYPKEILICTDDHKISNRSVVIKESLIEPNGEADEYTDILKEFFINQVGIKEFSHIPEMEQLATELSEKKQSIDAKFCEKLMRLVRFDIDTPNCIAFGEYAMFPYESDKGLKRVKANELVIGKPYIKEGRLITSAMSKPSLWSGFKKLLNDEELELLISFAEKYGAIGKPRIVQQSAKKHFGFDKELYVDGRKTDVDTDFDYVIPGLDTLLKRRSLQLNKLIWDALLSCKNPGEVIYAEYSVDKQQVVNRCESSLIQILKQRAWIPDQNNKLHAPGEILITDIHTDFAYDKRNPILNQLQFGAEIKRREKLRKELEVVAKKDGYMLVREEEYREFLKWKEMKKE